MKKFLVVSLLTIMVILSFSLALEALIDPEPPMGGGGGTLWVRKDISCNDFNYPAKEKTTCTAGGEEQCTAKYCN
jgi:hypothetical protein